MLWEVKKWKINNPIKENIGPGITGITHPIRPKNKKRKTIQIIIVSICQN